MAVNAAFSQYHFSESQVAELYVGGFDSPAVVLTTQSPRKRQSHFPPYPLQLDGRISRRLRSCQSPGCPMGRHDGLARGGPMADSSTGVFARHPGRGVAETNPS